MTVARTAGLSCLVAAWLASTSAAAFERALSADGAFLRWSEERALVVSMDSAPSHLSVRTVLDRAVASWNRCVHRLDVRAVQGESVDIRVRFIDAGWTHGASLVAHTEVASDGPSGRIQRVDIDIDASRPLSVGEGDAAGSFDLESVLVHELGHALGLAHSRDLDAVMRAGIKPGESPRRLLTDDDCAGLVATLSLPKKDKEVRKSRAESDIARMLTVGVLGVGCCLWGWWLRGLRR